jgi:hypothetical protein
MFHSRFQPAKAALVIGTASLLVGLASVGGYGVAVGQPGASSPQLNPRHPDTYVVRPGDTLWDIASMFLRDPWFWPEIWQINPQVENPHLIFPGDVLSLVYLDDGRPAIQLERAGTVERLSPRIRSEPLEDAIPTIPFETLRAFLSRPAILSRDQIDTLPYVLTPRDSLMGAAGRDVYVRGSHADEGTIYNIVHLGDPLVDPDDNALIGYEGIYVGQGRVRRTGDPATVYLTESAREAVSGDFLVDEEGVRPVNFFPRAPEAQIDGRIISVVDGVSLIGQYQVVVLNRGARHGLETGHVLRAYRTGEVVRDQVNRRGLFAQNVRLPDEPAGTMMVFRTFDRVSYALIMEATSEIRVLDAVRNPS